MTSHPKDNKKTTSYWWHKYVDAPSLECIDVLAVWDPTIQNLISVIFWQCGVDFGHQIAYSKL